MVQAEVEANKLVEDIKFDPLSVDTNDLTDYVSFLNQIIFLEYLTFNL